MEVSSVPINIFCPICKTDVRFVLSKSFLESNKRFPMSFRFLHGVPLHSANILFDNNLQIVKQDFMALQSKTSTIKTPSAEPLSELKIKKLDVVGPLFLNICQEVAKKSDVITMKAELDFYEAGFTLGEKVSPYITGNTELDILKELEPIWANNKIGLLQNIRQKDISLFFEIAECPGNHYFKDFGIAFCKIHEGFIRNIFQKKLLKNYLTKIALSDNKTICNYEIRCLWNSFAERLMKKSMKK